MNLHLSPVLVAELFKKETDAIALIKRIYLVNDDDDARATINALKEEIADLSTLILTMDKMVDAEKDLS